MFEKQLQNSLGWRTEPQKIASVVGESKVTQMGLLGLPPYLKKETVLWKAMHSTSFMESNA